MAQDEHLGAVVNAPDLLQVLERPAGWFFALPPTLSFFVYGLLTAYSIAAGGMVLARCGIKPLWVLLLLVPTLNLVCIWLWALRPWPADKLRGE